MYHLQLMYTHFISEFIAFVLVIIIFFFFLRFAFNFAILHYTLAQTLINFAYITAVITNNYEKMNALYQRMMFYGKMK